MTRLWKGKLLVDCSREELLGYIEYLQKFYDENTTELALKIKAKGRAKLFFEEVRRSSRKGL